MNNPKPSVKTGEFWLSAIAVIMPLLLSLNIIPHQNEVVSAIYSICTLLAALGFTAARTILKSLPTPAAPTSPTPVILQNPINVPAYSIPQVTTTNYPTPPVQVQQPDPTQPSTPGGI